MMQRIEREARTIDAMLGLYCRAHHGAAGELCADCRALRDYAHQRLRACPFQSAKPACNRCTVHCYSAPMKQRIRQVMRFSGPRMLLRYPRLALWHFIDLLRAVPRLEKPRRR